MSEVSRYALQRTIATGGMAHVYEAVAHGAHGFTRRVAIKRILPEFSHEQAVRDMFLDEARIASRMHHGNIVQVLDYGLLDGSELLVMEHVDGLDLSRVTQRALAQGQRMPLGLALHIVSEIAHALHHAHSLRDDVGHSYGVVHRDVSPQNVLLSWGGDVKLSDFGIALSSDRSSRTQTGVVKGKPDYMAPEQLRGEVVTGAADVYGLGATLKELLDTMENDGVPEVRPAAERLTATCLAASPKDRPSAEALARSAGNLARQCLDRDARGALQRFLEPLRPEPQGKIHALDDLMGMALFRSEDGRDFTVSKEARVASRESPLDAAPGDGGSDVPSIGASPALPTHRWGTMALGAAALMSLLAGGAVLGSGVAGTTAGPGAQPSTAVKASAKGMESETETEGADGVSAPGSQEAPADPLAASEGVAPVSGAPVRSGDRSLRGTRRRDGPAARRNQVSSMTSRPAAQGLATPEASPIAGNGTGQGWVRIGRRSNRQEQVWIDGQAAGFTPFSRSLPLGSHRIRVVDAETRTPLGERTALLTRVHTRSAPWVFPR